MENSLLCVSLEKLAVKIISTLFLRVDWVISWGPKK